MERIKVVSSSLKSVGYDGDHQVLEVEFLSGNVYQYLGVPQLLYEQLMVASSLGTFFSERIRNNFEFRQIR